MTVEVIVHLQQNQLLAAWSWTVGYSVLVTAASAASIAVSCIYFFEFGTRHARFVVALVAN